MKKRTWRILFGFIFLLLFPFIFPVYGAEEAPRISVQELDEIIDSPDLVILDVRTEKDWGNNDKKIVGSVRVDPRNINSWAGDYSKDQKIVLYCA